MPSQAGTAIGVIIMLVIIGAAVLIGLYATGKLGEKMTNYIDKLMGKDGDDGDGGDGDDGGGGDGGGDGGDGGMVSSSTGEDSSTPPETKDPGQQNGSDDAALTTGPCVYGGTSDGKFDNGFHCRLPDQICPKDIPGFRGNPGHCWTYGKYKYYTMPKITKAVPGKCPLGGSFDQVNCYLGSSSAACPPGVKKCFEHGGSKYYKPFPRPPV